jgi:hypothetical protein
MNRRSTLATARLEPSPRFGCSAAAGGRAGVSWATRCADDHSTGGGNPARRTLAARKSAMAVPIASAGNSGFLPPQNRGICLKAEANNSMSGAR